MDSTKFVSYTVYFVRPNTSEAIATEDETVEDDQVSVNTVIERRDVTESILMSSGQFQVSMTLYDFVTEVYYGNHFVHMYP